jgi:hypothetical protein
MAAVAGCGAVPDVYQSSQDAVSETAIVENGGLLFYRSFALGYSVRQTAHSGGKFHASSRKVSLIRYDFGQPSAQVFRKIDGQGIVPDNESRYRPYLIHSSEPWLTWNHQREDGCWPLQLDGAVDARRCQEPEHLLVIRAPDMATGAKYVFRLSRFDAEARRRGKSADYEAATQGFHFSAEKQALAVYDLGRFEAGSELAVGETSYYLTAIARSNGEMLFFQADVPMADNMQGSQDIKKIGYLGDSLIYLVGPGAADSTNTRYSVYRQIDAQRVEKLSEFTCTARVCNRVLAFVPERNEVYFAGIVQPKTGGTEASLEFVRINYVTRVQTMIAVVDVIQ